MPQKGFKKDDGVWGRREKIFSKVFPFFPRSQNNLCLEQSLEKNQKKFFFDLILEKNGLYWNRMEKYRLF